MIYGLTCNESPNQAASREQVEFSNIAPTNIQIFHAIHSEIFPTWPATYQRKLQAVVLSLPGQTPGGNTNAKYMLMLNICIHLFPRKML